jgi:hypothetical protein
LQSEKYGIKIYLELRTDVLVTLQRVNGKNFIYWAIQIQVCADQFGRRGKYWHRATGVGMGFAGANREKITQIYLWTGLHSCKYGLKYTPTFED